jgi:hypothetical protein
MCGYGDELQKAQFYVREEHHRITLDICDSIDKIYLGDSNGTIGVPEDMLFLLKEIPECEEWDFERRLIHNILDSGNRHMRSTNNIKKLQSRQAGLRMKNGFAPSVAS